MNINKLSVIAGLALGSFLATSNLAMAQDQKSGQRRGGVEQRMERLNEQLKLTDDQKPKVKTVLEESQKERQQLRSESSGAPQERQKKMAAILEKENKKLKEILTADQYTKYEKMREDLRSAAKSKSKKGQDAQEKKD